MPHAGRSRWVLLAVILAALVASCTGGLVLLGALGWFVGNPFAGSPDGAQPATRPDEAAGADSIVVPEFVGQAAAAAQAELESAGLTPRVRLGQPAPTAAQALRVYASNPAAGARLARGAAVELTAYAPAENRVTAVVPDPADRLTGVLISQWIVPQPATASPLTGRLALETTDLAVPAGAITIELARSLRDAAGAAGLLGGPWRLNWERRLLRLEDAVILDEGSQSIQFAWDTERKQFRAPTGDVLEVTDDGATRTLAEGATERYDAQGRLVERDERNGNLLEFRYDAESRLVRIDGPLAAFVELEFDERGRLAAARASSGAMVRYLYGDQPPTADEADWLHLRYAYDRDGRLATLVHPPEGAVRLEYDDAQRIASREWADGTREQYEYDDATRETRITDAADRVTVVRYDSTARRVEVIDADGQRSAAEYDGAGRLLKATGPTGQSATVAYDDRGRPQAVHSAIGDVAFEYLGETLLPAAIDRADGTTSDYEYDDRQNLVQVTVSGRDCPLAALEYGSAGLPTRIASCAGIETRLAYNDAGRLTRVTDPGGAVWEGDFDAQGLLQRQLDPDGGETRYAYDPRGRLTQVTAPDGGVRRYEYDGRGLLSRESDPSGGVIVYEHDERGRLAAETDPLGRQTRYTYDASGLLASVTDAAGSSTRFEYDAQGNLLRQVDALGAVTSWTYDALGRLTSETDAIGRTERFEYGPRGELTGWTSPAGRTTRYAYDDRNRLVQTTDAAGLATQWSYTDQGELAQTTAPNGATTRAEYDDGGHLVAIWEGDVAAARYEYDALGRRTRATYADGHEMSFEYDPQENVVAYASNSGGRVVVRHGHGGLPQSVTDSMGNLWQYRHDTSGRLVELADPLGGVTHRWYDAAGQLEEVELPNRDTTRYAFDAVGHLSAIHHPSGGQTTYRHDALGQLVEVSEPNGDTFGTTFDAVGRVLTLTDGKQQTTSFNYDADGRLQEKRLADGSTVRFGYDDQDRLVSIDDGAFPVQYGYDPAGNLTRIEYPALRWTLSYEYDERQRLTRSADTGGRTVDYGYDASGRLHTLGTGSGRPITWSYDAAGRPASVEYPNAVRAVWQYDSADRVQHLEYQDAAAGVLAGWSYEYDAAGRRTAVRNRSGQATRYEYDAAGQLIAESTADERIEYRYAPGGDRTRRLSGDDRRVYRYNEADQLIAAGPESFRYDANGNLVERRDDRGATRYEYDAADRLVTVELPDGAVVRYGYAPTGERIWREDAAGRTWFVSDGIHVVAELDDELRTVARYTHGPGLDRPLAMSREDQDYCYLIDALGSVHGLADARGGVAAGYSYDAFGNVVAEGDQVGNPLAFSGREYDAATGLYYHRARYYDPRLGRFLSRDPVLGDPTQPLSLNRYCYALNDPVSRTDPWGLAPPGGNPPNVTPPPQRIWRDGKAYDVFFRGHKELVASKGQPVLSPEAVEHGRMASYVRFLELIRQYGYKAALTLFHQTNEAGSPFVAMTSSPEVAGGRRFSTPRGEILELHYPVEEVAPPELWRGPQPRHLKLPNVVVPIPVEAGELEWVTEGHIPRERIARIHPGGRTPPRPATGLRPGPNRGGFIVLPEVNAGQVARGTFRVGNVGALGVLGGVDLTECLVDGHSYAYCVAMLGGKGVVMVVGAGAVTAVVGTTGAAVILTGLTLRELYHLPGRLERLAEGAGGDELLQYGWVVRLREPRRFTLPFRLPHIPDRVPSVIGQHAEQAQRTLKDAGLNASFSFGKAVPDAKLHFQVYDQSPQAGWIADPGSEVTVTVYVPDAPLTLADVEVPNVVGMERDEAERAITAAGLVPEGTGDERAPPAGRARNDVFEQKPPAKQMVAGGETVEFRYYAGIVVPNVVGQKRRDAEALLTDLGLVVQTTVGEKSAPSPAQRGTVYEQLPAADSVVLEGDGVELTVYSQSGHATIHCELVLLPPNHPRVAEPTVGQLGYWSGTDSVQTIQGELQMDLVLATAQDHSGFLERGGRVELFLTQPSQCNAARYLHPEDFVDAGDGSLEAFLRFHVYLTGFEADDSAQIDPRFPPYEMLGYFSGPNTIMSCRFMRTAALPPDTVQWDGFDIQKRGDRQLVLDMIAQQTAPLQQEDERYRARYEGNDSYECIVESTYSPTEIVNVRRHRFVDPRATNPERVSNCRAQAVYRDFWIAHMAQATRFDYDYEAFTADWQDLLKRAKTLIDKRFPPEADEEGLDPPEEPAQPEAVAD
jgi:RHS repeat-associated protein